MSSWMGDSKTDVDVDVDTALLSRGHVLVFSLGNSYVLFSLGEGGTYH